MYLYDILLNIASLHLFFVACVAGIYITVTGEKIHVLYAQI